MTTAYHLTPEPWFRAQPDDAPLWPEPFERDGFTHLTHGLDDVLAVGNAFYRADARPQLLLTIDLDRLTSPVRYDDPDQRYPHVYGPLDRAAIMVVARVRRDAAGCYLGIEGEYD